MVTRGQVRARRRQVETAFDHAGDQVADDREEVALERAVAPAHP